MIFRKALRPSSACEVKDKYVVIRDARGGKVMIEYPRVDGFKWDTFGWRESDVE